MQTQEEQAVEEVKDGSQLIKKSKKKIVSSDKTLGITMGALTCVALWLHTHTVSFMVGWKC